MKVSFPPGLCAELDCACVGVCLCVGVASCHLPCEYCCCFVILSICWGRRIVLCLFLSFWMASVFCTPTITPPKGNMLWGCHGDWVGSQEQSVCVYESERSDLYLSPRASNICETLCWCGGILICFCLQIHIYHNRSACVCKCDEWATPQLQSLNDGVWLARSTHWGLWSVYQ